MARLGNFFRSMFGKLSINKVNGGAAITVDFSAFGHKLDIAQQALDAQVWNDMQQYMPHGSTGNLIAQTGLLNANASGEVFVYPPELDYGHYQYEGIKYVDPVYGIGAFYDPDYGYWSRPNVKKIPSDIPLFYSSPKAEAHWDEVAYANHGDEWVRVAKRAMT